MRVRVVMFEERFAEAVRSGAKRQTIRVPWKQPIEPGEVLDLRHWLGVAYRSPRERLRMAACVGNEYITITPRQILLDHGMLRGYRGARLDTFARLDGFRNWEDMLEWFRNKGHSLPFEGDLIRWSEFEYRDYHKVEDTTRAVRVPPRKGGVNALGNHQSV